MKRMTMEMPMKVAPSGFPTCRRRDCGVRGRSGFDSEMVVLRRKSWVTAMPMEAKEREVRSQARKVRSGGFGVSDNFLHMFVQGGDEELGVLGSQGVVCRQVVRIGVAYQVQGDLEQHFPYSPAPRS